MAAARERSDSDFLFSGAFLRVEIPAYRITESGLSKHVEYKLSIIVQSKITDCLISKWEVFRRFKEFEQLDDSLHKELGDDDLKKFPKLPSKGLIRSFDESYILQKQVDLQVYISQVLQSSAACESEVLSSFLTGSLAKLSSMFADIHSEAAHLKIMLSRELASLSVEREQLRDAAAHSESQRQAAVSQLQSYRRANSSLQAQIDRLQQELQLSSTSSAPLPLLPNAPVSPVSPVPSPQASPRSDGSAMPPNVELQLLKEKSEWLQHQLEAANSEKAAAAEQIKRLVGEKKMLVKEVKAQRAVLSASSPDPSHHENL